MAITQYGPGDSETWGPCTGHPADPRTPELDDLDDEPAPDEWPFPTFRGKPRPTRQRRRVSRRPDLSQFPDAPF
jgi:hypothetical protein